MIIGLKRNPFFSLNLTLLSPLWSFFVPQGAEDDLRKVTDMAYKQVNSSFCGVLLWERGRGESGDLKLLLVLDYSMYLQRGTQGKLW